MRKLILSLFMLSAWTALAADEPKKSPLDTVDAKKLLPKQKPTSQSRDVIAVLGLQEGMVDCLAVRPDGKQLAISGPDGIIRLWDLTTLRYAMPPLRHQEVVSLCYSPDSKLIAAGDSAGGVRVWDVSGKVGMPKGAAAAHKAGPVWSLAFSPDGKTLASGGPDKDPTIKLWEIAPKLKPKGTLSGHTHSIRSLAFSPDGSLLASAGADDKTFRLWDAAATPPTQKEVVTGTGAIGSVVFSADSKTLATAGSDGCLRVWSLEEGKPKAGLVVESGKRVVKSLCMSPDAKLFAGITPERNGGALVVWDAEGKIVKEWKYPHHVHAAAFHPDGRHLFGVNEDSTYIYRLK